MCTVQLVCFKLRVLERGNKGLPVIGHGCGRMRAAEGQDSSHPFVCADQLTLTILSHICAAQRSTVALAHSSRTRRQYCALAEKRGPTTINIGDGRGSNRSPELRRCMSRKEVEEADGVTPCRATMLAVDNNRVRIVVEADVHQLLEDMEAGKQ